MDVKKGVKIGVAGVTGIFAGILLLFVGIFIAIFASLFWIFLFAVIGLGSYALILGVILGILSAIGLMYGWLSNQ